MRDTVPPSSDSGGANEAGGLVPFAHQKWTLDTIKIHYDSRLADMQRYYSDLLSVQEQTNRDRFTSAEKAVYAALAASDKAVSAAMASSKEAINKAETAADKRFESLNELRSAMMDQQKNFAPAVGTELQFKSIDARLTEIKEGLAGRIDGVEKKQEATVNKVLGVGILITFIVSMVAIFGGLVGASA